MQIALYLGQPHTCSYLHDRIAQSVFIDPDFPLTRDLYQQMMEQGFRRSGNLVYRPRCRGCSNCIACRIPIAEFQPNRAQRRCLRINTDIELCPTPANVFTDEHYELYRIYQQARHRDSNMAESDRQETANFLLSAWCTTELLEIRLNHQLVGLAVTDVLPHALSAVYTFFHPDMQKRSLGTLAILRQIEYARQLGKPHLYLGYWVPDSAKMHYKQNFKPLQLLTTNGWWEPPSPASA